MKINFKKITQIIKKYKYIILLFIVIIILYNLSSISEGFIDNIGKYYAYLQPPPSTDKIDYETWKKFIVKHLEIRSNRIDKDENLRPESKEFIKKMFDERKQAILTGNDNFLFNNMKAKYYSYVTKPELNYYIKNGKFPYTNYVMKSLNKAIDKRRTEKEKKGNVKFPNNSTRIDSMRVSNPNRLIYKLWIYPYESKQNPLPLSAKIYLGQEKPDQSIKPTFPSVK